MELVEIDEISKLKQAQILSQRIRSVLSELNVELNDIREAIYMNSDLIITSAEHINRSLFAPVKWQPGGPLFGADPPAPQPDMMRAGILGKSHASFEVSHVQNVVGATDASTNPVMMAEKGEEKAPMAVPEVMVQRPPQPQIVPQQPPANLKQSVAPKVDMRRSTDAPVSAAKRSRTININFGFSDSEDSD